MKSGCLFVISGPSAVGKTSVVNYILRSDESIEKVVTCTTREKRKSECHGIDYFFMSPKDFMLGVSNGNFIEYSEVYGNYYGVMLSSIREKIDIGKDAILVINWDGFLKIKAAIKENVLGVFILPPSIKDLELRIKSRGEDSPDVIARRILEAKNDIDHAKDYDFCFENINITSTARDILERINYFRR